MKLNELKIALVRQILHSEDADELRTVDGLLNHGAPFELSAKEKAELDKDFADYKGRQGAQLHLERGEGTRPKARMSYSPDFRPAAREDIAEGYAWYEARRQGLGEAFLLEVQRCMMILLHRSGAFRRIHKDSGKHFWTASLRRRVRFPVSAL
ncbi:MAG: hypothetical protein IPI55_09640 [Flavobacteriales bacterium]|nr:hypothetical protein [Flavobacteriales bacterium]